MGFFFCIEGIDGAGKNTQSKLLMEKLSTVGKTCSLYTYPDYREAYGKRIKAFLDKEIEIDVEELTLLYAIDMLKDKKRVSEKLNNGEIIITDRYFISTVAYGSAGGFDYERLKVIEETIALPKPSAVFYLDIPVDISSQRKMREKSSLDRFEESAAYLGRVKSAYDRLYEEKFATDNWVKIDGKESINKIHETIFSTVKEIIG